MLRKKKRKLCLLYASMMLLLCSLEKQQFSGCFHHCWHRICSNGPAQNRACGCRDVFQTSEKFKENNIYLEQTWSLHIIQCLAENRGCCSSIWWAHSEFSRGIFDYYNSARIIHIWCLRWHWLWGMHHERKADNTPIPTWYYARVVEQRGSRSPSVSRVWWVKWTIRW